MASSSLPSTPMTVPPRSVPRPLPPPLSSSPKVSPSSPLSSSPNPNPNPKAAPSLGVVGTSPSSPALFVTPPSSPQPSPSPSPMPSTAFPSRPPLPILTQTHGHTRAASTGWAIAKTPPIPPPASAKPILVTDRHLMGVQRAGEIPRGSMPAMRPRPPPPSHGPPATLSQTTTATSTPALTPIPAIVSSAPLPSNTSNTPSNTPSNNTPTTSTAEGDALVRVAGQRSDSRGVRHRSTSLSSSFPQLSTSPSSPSPSLTSLTSAVSLSAPSPLSDADTAVCVFCSLYATFRMKLTITGAEQRRFCRKCSREDPPLGSRLCTNPLCRELFVPPLDEATRRCVKCDARLFTKRR